MDQEVLTMKDLQLTNKERLFIDSIESLGLSLEIYRTDLGYVRGLLWGYKASVGDLVPNPWNHNEANAPQFAAISESVKAYGSVAPLLCRVAPEENDSLFQIVDGEQRFFVASTDAILPINVLFGFSEAELKKLTVVMDESRGSANPQKLAALLAGLKETGASDDQVSYALPFSARTIEAMVSGLNAAKAAAPEHEPAHETVHEAPVEVVGSQPTSVENFPLSPEEITAWTTITMTLSQDAMIVVREAYDRVDAEVGGLSASPVLAWGRLFELVCADYLGR